MRWKCYLAICKSESPVHIGYRQIGILKTTRYYITGRAMWGAITANLTRALFGNPTPEDYQAVGNFVKENIRTTYFYPAIKADEANLENLSEYKVEYYSVFLPEYTNGGLKFGNKSKEWFEQKFVGSFVSTAIESQTRTAEEGSLHEFEYIRDRINLPKPVQVYWLGYLFVNFETTIAEYNAGKVRYNVQVLENDGIKITFKNAETYTSTLDEATKLLFVGGERNYGLGKITRVEFKPLNSENKIFGKFEFKLDSEPIVEIKDGNPIFAHLSLESVELNKEFIGEIEPLVGLEWSGRGAGQKISESMICATPGSIIEQKELTIGYYGVLR